MKKFFLIHMAICVIIQIGATQNVLTLDEAIDKALVQNHFILMAENNEAISKNNAHPGAAGLLPLVQLSGNTEYTVGNANLSYSENLPFPDESDARATSLVNSAGVGFSYIIFDGMKNVNTLKRLKTISGKSELETQLNVEQIILQVIGVYLETARTQSLLEIAKKNLNISLDRIENAKLKLDYGGTQLSVLNAQINLNLDSLNYLDIEKRLQNNRRDLNLLLGEKMETQYVLDNVIVLNETLALETLLSNAFKNNIDIRIADANIAIADQNSKIANSSKYPVLKGNAGFLTNYASNDIGIAAQLGSYGFSGGVNLSIPIFDGNIGRKQMQNATIAIENANINKERNELNMEHNIYNLFADYTNSRSILEMQTKNLAIAQQNYERTEQAYQSGLINNLTLREAQLSLINTENFIENAKFAAKMYEYQLLQSAGMLMQ